MTRPVIDLDQSVWVMGPTSDDTFDGWLADTCKQVLKRFGVARVPAAKEMVTQVLTRIAVRGEDDLPFIVVHWPALQGDLVPVRWGLLAKDETYIDEWLRGADLVAPEPATVDRPPTGREGVTLTRSRVASTGDGDEPMTSFRYVLDTGDPESVVVALLAGYGSTEALEHVQDDLVAMLRTVRFVADGEEPETVTPARPARRGFWRR